MKRHSLSFLTLGFAGLIGLMSSCETEPTCSDGLKNGTEGDVDCGLTCGVLCGDTQACALPRRLQERSLLSWCVRSPKLHRCSKEWH